MHREKKVEKETHTHTLLIYLLDIQYVDLREQRWPYSLPEQFDGSIIRIAFISPNPRIFRASARVGANGIYSLIRKYHMILLQIKPNASMILEALCKKINMAQLSE